MSRLYGRSLRGKRCLSKVPHGHWQTATFIAALRCDGICAPMLLDGPMDGNAFLAYIEQILCPELRVGDIVICDNLACHKIKGVQEAIAAAGGNILYLPAYSPDFNPIEMAFAKLKASLRHAAGRTLPELIKALSKSLDSFSQSHCLNFFRHAQYATD